MKLSRFSVRLKVALYIKHTYEIPHRDGMRISYSAVSTTHAQPAARTAATYMAT